MSATQAVRTPAYQVLADDIRADITSGRLRPGDRLPTEPQLSARSGLSRSTVREALRLLSSQHLIVTVRGVTGGSFVAHPSPDKLADTLATGMRLLMGTSAVGASELLEVRAMLEVPAAGLAARRRTPEQLAELAAAMFDPLVADLDTVLRMNRAFHLALAASANNPLYEVITTPLYAIVNERQLAKAGPPDMWIEVDAAHRAILRAVELADPAGATAAAVAHIAYLRDIFAGLPPVGAAAEDRPPVSLAAEDRRHRG